MGGNSSDTPIQPKAELGWLLCSSACSAAAQALPITRAMASQNHNVSGVALLMSHSPRLMPAPVVTCAERELAVFSCMYSRTRLAEAGAEQCSCAWA